MTLASGIRVSKVEEEVGVDASDPFKLKTGGLLDLAKAKQAKALEDPSAKDRSALEIIMYCDFFGLKPLIDKMVEMLSNTKRFKANLFKNLGNSNKKFLIHIFQGYIRPGRRGHSILP